MMRTESNIRPIQKPKFKDVFKDASLERTLDARARLWRSMIEDFELTWLKDVHPAAGAKIVEMTLHKMRENRAREEGWRMFFSERFGT